MGVFLVTFSVSYQFKWKTSTVCVREVKIDTNVITSKIII